LRENVHEPNLPRAKPAKVSAKVNDLDLRVNAATAWV